MPNIEYKIIYDADKFFKKDKGVLTNIIMDNVYRLAIIIIHAFLHSNLLPENTVMIKELSNLICKNDKFLLSDKEYQIIFAVLIKYSKQNSQYCTKILYNVLMPKESLGGEGMDRREFLKKAAS